MNFTLAFYDKFLLGISQLERECFSLSLSLSLSLFGVHAGSVGVRVRVHEERTNESGFILMLFFFLSFFLTLG